MPLLLIESVSQTLSSPIATFVLLLAIALLIPPLFERLKLPGLVGLLVAGILFGQSALGWLDPTADVMKLLSEIGKIYLMFVAGLDIDLALFQKTRNRSLSFGALTFAVPCAGGIAVGLFFGYGWLAAVLIGSLLASHTLLAYPVIQRLGVVGDEGITITVGATIFTDVLSLVVLAVCLGVSKGDFTTTKLIILLGSLGLYAIAVLWGLKRLAAGFFRTTGQDEGNQFLFVMLSVFLAAVGAQLIGVEGIIGAFLAGLAINSVIGDGPVKEKTEFLGNVLFIPMFFINMGLLLDLTALKSLISMAQLPLAIIATLLGTKLIAALITKGLFRYSWPQTWTMWSLSVPQVAATLAAALVGYEAGIINVQVFNSVILLMLTTAIVGPLVTARSARSLVSQVIEHAIEYDTEQVAQPATKPATDQVSAPLTWLPVPAAETAFNIVVPVYNLKTEAWLLALAATIARYERGQVTPLAIAPAQPKMNSPRLQQALLQCQRRLDLASSMGADFGVPMTPRLRVEYSVPQAICHVSREDNARLIVMGMRARSPVGLRLLNNTLLNNALLNNVHDAVLWSAHCPVVVARLLDEPSQFKNILLPVEALSPRTIRVLRFAQVLAATNGGSVTLVRICSPLNGRSQRTRFYQQLERLVSQLPAASCNIDIQVLAKENWVSAVTQMAGRYDLVVLRSQRRRSGRLLLESGISNLLERLPGSVILVGEP